MCNVAAMRAYVPAFPYLIAFALGNGVTRGLAYGTATFATFRDRRG
jgi:hypothetical protein